MAIVKNEEWKARRRARDKIRRKNGTLKSWSYQRRLSDEENGNARRMIHAAKSRAKRKGLEFTITHEDIYIPSHCPVLGLEFSHRIGKSGPCENSPTLDRIDNKLGYVPGNIEVISWRANRIKCDATPKELMRVAKYYVKKRRIKTTTKNKKKATG
jgi:hypothetical protein